MSAEQKQRWSIGAIVAVAALCLQLGVLLVAGGRKTQQIDTLIALATQASESSKQMREQIGSDALKIQALQLQVESLHKQVLHLELMIDALRKRLEDKKVVGEVTPSDPIARGEKPIVKTL